MKLIAIGDCHGRNNWEKIVADNPDAEKIVFIGDYFDSFDVNFEEQMDNFLKIIAFKDANPDKVVLLIGNHEFHYIANEQYSGYQDRFDASIRAVIERAIDMDYLQMAYQNEDYLFTHAGVTLTWYMNNYDVRDSSEFLADEINDIFRKHPEAFKFTPSTGLDNTGDSITQSPIWVRPRALLSDCFEGFKQVVGHTHQRGVKMVDNVIFIDTFDTCDEYLIIKDGVEEIGNGKEKI